MSLIQTETQSQKLKSSLERIYPSQMNRGDRGNRQALAIHLQRYRFAAQQLLGPRVLDIACGCGYGTALMAAKHPKIFFLGVDIDPLAVAYAQETYKAPNLKFECGNGMTFSFKDLNLEERVPFNTIVSLETIEHVPEPMGMVSNLLQQLSTGGRMIASVPTTPTVDGNPHHLHDFTKKSFYKLFAHSGYIPKACYEQIQPWKLAGIFSRKKSEDNRSQGVARNVLKHYQKKPQALVSRVSSIVINGLNNRYLTAKFEKR